VIGDECGGAISVHGIKAAKKKRPLSARAIPHTRADRGGEAERGEETNAGRRQAPAASLIDVRREMGKHHVGGRATAGP